MATGVIMTYADYAALPNDGRRYEVLAGEIAVTPAPSPKHQQISRNLFRVLDSHARGRGLGEVLYAPVDCILTDVTIVQPDIIFLATARLGAISGRGIEGPPTLVVEIVSPQSRQFDRITKFQLYARHGVEFYWIVDPDALTIQAFALAGGGYQPSGTLEGIMAITLPPFPDCPLNPADLWP
jgi:Uma2 family endonuclease